MKTSKRINRFIIAQNKCGVYKHAVGEIRAGHKESHWMWFIFPQLRGLGVSAMSDYYGIRGLGEAHTYLRNKTLRTRLREITKAALTHAGVHPYILFGSTVDSMKAHSCFTLFKHAALTKCDRELFTKALKTFFNGQECVSTTSILL